MSDQLAPTSSRRGKPAKRRSQALRREQSSHAILDTAERLFARYGRDGVTIKAIADMAGVDTALIHYYFVDKDGVFEAVWSRRVTPLNEAREAAMDHFEASLSGRPHIEDALNVFLRPIFEMAFTNGEGWSNFAAIAAAANSSRFGGAEFMDAYFDPIVRRFIQILRRAAPSTPDRDLYWFFPPTFRRPYAITGANRSN